MKITHSYIGMGLQYQQARKGTPGFAAFMISHSGFNSCSHNLPLTLVEFGIGSGQQTEFVEKELNARGLTHYKILAYDKSYQSDPGSKDTHGTHSSDNPGQLNLLMDRIKRGELSEKIIPVQYDFDGAPLPLKSESVDLTYMAHVFHHLTRKEQALNEIARISIEHGRLFILGVTIEDLENHPLGEFFPEKYEYDSTRYPTESQLKNMFKSAGLSFEKPYRIGKDQVKPMDSEFLASVENTTIDSVLRMIKENDPPAFEQGVQKVKREVERAEKSGCFRTYFTTIARVFWGIKNTYQQVKIPAAAA